VSVVATDIQSAVEDAAAYLYVWALKDIPQDLRDAIRGARERETSTPGQRVLDTIIKNVGIADDQQTLVCQDTGIAVYYCRVGEHFPLHPARIYEALYDGTARATACRSSTGTSSPTGTASTSSASPRARAPRA
jgi:tartrate dehydratase alpha subunit/fumarate hydratase class I-like protein